MSDIKGLQEAYRALTKRYRLYFSECHDFAKRVIDTFAEQLNIDKQERITFYPVDGSRDRDKRYNIAGSMRLHDDTYWHLGFNLLIFTEDEGFPVILPFEFKFKKEHGGFEGSIWGFNNIQETFDKYGDLNKFTAKIIRGAKESLENSLDEFLTNKDIKKIGFLNKLPHPETDQD